MIVGGAEGRKHLFERGYNARMKFTLRDLLWLVLVVALGLGWAVDRSQLAYGYRLCLSRAAQVTDYLERVEDLTVEWRGEEMIIHRP
jgi:hypothetical protein